MSAPVRFAARAGAGTTLALIAAALLTFAPSPSPADHHAGSDHSAPRPRAEVTSADWQHDLAVLVEELEAIHPNPWFHTSRADIEAAARELNDALPGMSWEESYAGICRIVAMVRDGHTSVPAWFNHGLGLQRVQVLYGLFGAPGRQELRVLRVTPEHSALLGGRVTRLGGLEVAEAIRRVSAHIPADNDWTERDRLPHYLTIAELLAGCGVLTGTDTCPIEVEIDGQLVRAELPTAADHNEGAWPSAMHADAPPLYRQQPGRNWFYEPLPAQDAVYLCYRRVRNHDDQTFADFCAGMFAYLEEHEVDRLIVDLRQNGGGNNYLNRPLIHGIIRNDRVNREGSLWVITGRTTFSAAMCGTIELERQTEALFAGEPTGASPNHHGDHVPVELPRTGVQVVISALYWQNSDPRDARPWLTPDLPVELTWADWEAGRDPVLDTVLSWEGGERQGVGYVMSDWLEEGVAVETALRRLEEIREGPEATKYDFGEYQLNAVGYGLASQDRYDEAITVLRRNVEWWPRAWNPWDSLGEVLAQAGRTAEAVKAYERSVELNPANGGGQAALRRLRKQLAGGGAGS